jgi:hypothetical protein
MKYVNITIGLDGEVTMEAQGFHGKGCDKVLKDLADGQTPKIDIKKAEYREQARETEKARP